MNREGVGAVLRASPIWIVRLPAAPVAHDDKLRRVDFAPRSLKIAVIPPQQANTGLVGDPGDPVI
jgi:hypothetical protein